VSGILPLAEKTESDHSSSVFVTAPDGLTLHVRRYGSRAASALPVVCLPGLARTAADFHPVAGALAADPAQPRLVLALDYRGHGRSEYDRNPDNYTLSVALSDLLAVLIALEIAPAIFLGTSYGGLPAMMLAVWRPAAIAGVILNDIGPVTEPPGLGADQKLCQRLPDPPQLRRRCGNSALVVRGPVPEAHTAGLDRVRPPHLARALRQTRTRL
jgi:pimeloyl-ACP methyl ester carboxylesterase